MRVLFWYRGIESLGLGYLMSMLTHHGHEIDLIFEPGLDDNTVFNFPALARLNRHDALVERAKAFDPHLVCIGSPTNLWSHAARMGERLKRELDVPIVVGGHHAQALPEYVIGHPWVDVVCTGEGELALLELVERMRRGEDYPDVPTMWVKDDDGVVHRNEIGMLENDLDRLPFPEKQLWWDWGAFRDNLEVFTGRGCPFKCTFCNIHYQREIFEDKGDFLRKRSVGQRHRRAQGQSGASTTSVTSRCTTTTSRPTSCGSRSSARCTATRSASPGTASGIPPRSSRD